MSVSLNISFREVILYIFFVHILIFTHFPLFFIFLTFYNVNILTDHRFIPANLLILPIDLFRLNKDIFIIIIIIFITIIKLELQRTKQVFHEKNFKLHHKLSIL